MFVEQFKLNTSLHQLQYISLYCIPLHCTGITDNTEVALHFLAGIAEASI